MSANDARRRQILDLIASAGYESVQSLSQRLGVSEMTIRRDLDDLEGRGLLRRIHGGAVADQIGEHLSVDFKIRRGQRTEAKALIGKAAAERIGDGQSVYLDAGSTVLAIAEALGARARLTVITPSLPLASALSTREGITTILLGGSVRSDLMSVIGPIAEQNLATFHIDLAILGTGGFDPQRGLNHSSLEEIPLKRLAARLAAKVVVVATSEKRGRAGLMYYLPTSEIDEILTDAEGGTAVESIAISAASASG